MFERFKSAFEMEDIFLLGMAALFALISVGCYLFERPVPDDPFVIGPGAFLFGLCALVAGLIGGLPPIGELLSDGDTNDY